MVAFSYQLEPQALKNLDDFLGGSINGELALDSHPCFSNKGFENRGFAFKDLFPESLYVKGDGGLNVGQSFLVGISLTHNDTLQAEWISYVSIRVLFHNDLELSDHLELPQETVSTVL
jgi:hypothetical protein